MCVLRIGRMCLSFIITWIQKGYSRQLQRMHKLCLPTGHQTFKHCTNECVMTGNQPFCSKVNTALKLRGKGVLYFFVSLCWLAIAYVALPNFGLTTETQTIPLDAESFSLRGLHTFGPFLDTSHTEKPCTAPELPFFETFQDFLYVLSVVGFYYFFIF